MGEQFSINAHLEKILLAISSQKNPTISLPELALAEQGSVSVSMMHGSYQVGLT